jgi:hypothetical protein
MCFLLYVCLLPKRSVLFLSISVTMEKVLVNIADITYSSFG